MEEAKLRLLLNQKESGSLEFKRELHKVYDSDKKRKEFQRDELRRDILSLANGNATSAGETAYFIIGADNKLNDEGNRNLYDVGAQVLNKKPELNEKQLLDWVNPICDPPLDAIRCNLVEIEGKKLFVITIPPTPYLHETTKRLQTSSKKIYSERTAFIRRDEGIRPASAKERETILTLKRIRLQEKRNVPPIQYGIVIGVLLGGTIMASVAPKIIIENENVNVNVPMAVIISLIVGSFTGGFLGGSMGYAYRDFISIKPGWALASPKRRISAVTAIMIYLLLSAFIWWYSSSLIFWLWFSCPLWLSFLLPSRAKVYLRDLRDSALGEV